MTTDPTDPRPNGQAAEPLALRLNDQLGPLPEPATKGTFLGPHGYSVEDLQAYAAQAVARERQRTMFARRPGLWALQAREVLELIAAQRRPDGTWNRDREACRQMAAEALGRYED